MLFRSPFAVASITGDRTHVPKYHLTLVDHVDSFKVQSCLLIEEPSVDLQSAAGEVLIQVVLDDDFFNSEAFGF